MALLQECPRCKVKLSFKFKVEGSEGEQIKKVLKVRESCPVCGCNLLKAPKRVFWIEYYQEGRRRRQRIGTNKALAQTVLQKRLVERAEGRLLDKKKVNNIRFSDLA